MTTKVMGKYIEETIEARKFNLAQRLALMYFHPRKLFLGAASSIWVAYFLWYQDWLTALFVWLVFSIVGYISVWDVDVQAMSETTLGKLALLHLHPANFTIQAVSAIPLIYGLWTHTLEYILIGFSIAFVGHIFGWKGVNAKYALSGNGWPQ